MLIMSKDDDSKKILSDLNPGWLTNQIKNKTSNYYNLLDFYVINTICDRLSCKGKNVFKIGWEKKICKKGTLRNKLLSVISDDSSISEHVFIAKTNAEIRRGFSKLNLDKQFHAVREEKIVAYKKYNLNQIESIFYHIRNSFAHGRFQVYTSKTNGTFYVFESGIIKKSIEKIDLKTRMVIKESILLKWIEIINNPFL